MKTWYIYTHFTKDTNELFYIGVGTGNRINSKTSRNDYWKNIVAKHGYEAVIIFDNYTDRDEAVQEEIYLQELHKPKACLQYGDGLLSKHSDETRAKMSNSARGNTSHLGYKHTEKTKRNISIKKTGIKQTKEHIQRKIKSDTRLKMSLAKQNITADTRLKMSLAKQREIICIETGIIYKSVSHAAGDFKTSVSNISKVLKGVNKTAKKHTFKYLEGAGNE